MKFSQLGEWLRDQRRSHGRDQHGMARQLINAAKANNDPSVPDLPSIMHNIYPEKKAHTSPPSGTSCATAARSASSGISDTYALGVLAETTGLDVPIVVLPFVNSALASRPPFRRSVQALRAEGVRILLGPGKFEPHPPRTGELSRAMASAPVRRWAGPISATGRLPRTMVIVSPRSTASTSRSEKYLPAA